MQAVILKENQDITLYNGETTTSRIIRLLSKYHISYIETDNIKTIK